MEGGHSDACADAKICKKLAQILSLFTKKIAGSRGFAPDPIVTAVCLYI